MSWGSTVPLLGGSFGSAGGRSMLLWKIGHCNLETLVWRNLIKPNFLSLRFAARERCFQSALRIMSLLSATSRAAECDFGCFHALLALTGAPKLPEASKGMWHKIGVTANGRSRKPWKCPLRVVRSVFERFILCASHALVTHWCSHRNLRSKWSG